MHQNCLMAIDAGTGSIRAVLFDLRGNQLSCAQSEWTHREDPQYPGSMDFDWEYNWKLACACIQEAIAKAQVSAGDIVGVSTTCMREGIVLYDGEGKEIWACANVDARSGQEVAELIAASPEMEKDIYLESGQTYALGALPRLLWVKKKKPRIYEKIAKIGMFNDWLIYKMTGVLAVEPSNGSTTGIFNLQSRSWNAEIAQKCGLRSDIFPEVAECGSILAVVNRQGAEDTGLLPGTPAVVGGGDAQLGCVGVGVVKPNEAAIFGGSFWQYEFNTAQAVTDAECRVRVNCHSIPNLWQFEAISFQPGLVMRWYRDGFCQQEKQMASQNNCDPYHLMDQEAALIPVGANGVRCTFSDVMNFIRWKHAAPTFTNFGLDPEKFNKFTFYRAILENTALLAKGHLKLVQDVTGKAPNEVVFANGASKSPLWCQIIADAIGLPVKVPVVKEATALGAAILAGYGTGIYLDLARTAKELVKWDRTYEPNTENHKIYEEMYEPWRELYRAQLALTEKKLTIPMWKAPGL